ncbi:MAG: hypothetical protein RQ751_11655 [Longimicrobiales bacterium]|nr:hypothetical protein [Longimicrobiales bacterium]
MFWFYFVVAAAVVSVLLYLEAARGKPKRRSAVGPASPSWTTEETRGTHMKPGHVDGQHFTGHVDTVKQLKREGRLDEARDLLLRLVEATEEEARANRWGVAPWYYEQLAIIYRKLKQPQNELVVLERYDRQPKAPGAGPSKLAERLAKVRAQLDRSSE